MFKVANRCVSIVLANGKSSRTAIRPIIDKTELDNIAADDPRHFQDVKPVDGYESNAMSYHPKIQ